MPDPITITLTKILSVPLANWLLKYYLGEPFDAVGKVITDIAATKITEYNDQLDAEERFKRIGRKIVQRLEPLFLRAGSDQEVSPEAVIYELQLVIEAGFDLPVLMALKLEPSAIVRELKKIRPLPPGLGATETALYERALNETVRLLLDAAAELPKFEVESVRASLARLGRVEDKIDEALKRAANIETRLDEILGQGDDEAKKYEEDYRRAILREWDKVEIIGANVEPEAKRQALSVAYVSLNVQQKDGMPQSVQSVMNTLKPGADRIIIDGEAGGGKSTMFRWVTLTAAGLLTLPHQSRFDKLSADSETFWRSGSPKDGLSSGEVDQEDDPGDWRQRVPFLILLRNCPDGILPSAEDFPELISKQIGKPPTKWVQNILEGGRALILLDGIDEVPTGPRAQLRDSVESLMKAYPDAYFMLSTRPAALDKDWDYWLASTRFRRMWVNRLSEGDKRRFILKWHEAVEDSLREAARPTSHIHPLAVALVNKLPDHPNISRLANNPLLCALICAFHLQRNGDLPKNQMELYEDICRMLLQRREAESRLDLSGFPGIYPKLTYPQKKSLVQEIAHWMVLNNQSVIPRDLACNIVARILPRFKLEISEADEPDSVLATLLERSGILREARPGYLDFLHNTLKEYLAAEIFVENRDIGLLAGRYADPSWENVVLFAAGTRTPKDFAGLLIDAVLDLPASENSVGTAVKRRKGSTLDADVRAHQLFALRCREYAVELDPGLNLRLLEFLNDLFPPKNMSEAEVLAYGGDAVVQALAFRPRAGVRTNAACVRALRLIGTQKSREIIKTYFGLRNPAVMVELAQAAEPLYIPGILESFLAGNLDEGVRRQISDLSPLSQLTGLRSLYLRQTQVADLSPLSQLTGLQSLDLMLTQVADLSPLSQLTGLQSFNLMQTEVADLSPLSQLTGLQRLDLVFTQVADLSPLSQLNGLRSLDLEMTQVADLNPLSQLTGLQSLDLSMTRVADLSPLSQLTGLQSLDLAGTKVADLSALSQLTGLRSLDLSGTQVADLSPLSQLTGLQSLHLSGTQVADLSPLSQLSNLLIIGP